MPDPQPPLNCEWFSGQDRREWFIDYCDWCRYRAKGLLLCYPRLPLFLLDAPPVPRDPVCLP